MINNSYSNEGAVELSKPAGLNKRSNSDHIQGLKKGPWTAAEDAILTEYVRKHGEGNWNSVQKNSGLMRCGKSCRLRWANHLRPNLKKGSFTPEEERIIIELHAKIGNKWARMATQLPGRTDNEIKNFWNTRMKRRRRAGLPVYPHEVQKEVAAPYQFQPQQQQQEQEPQRQPNSSSASLSSLLSPTHQNASFIPPFSMFDPINFTSAVNPMQNHLGSAVYSNPNHQFKLFGDGSCNHGAGLPALPHSPVSPYLKPPPPPSTLLNQNLVAQAMPTSPSTPQPVQYSPSNFANNISFTSLIMGGQVEEVGLSHDGLKQELPSNQTLPQAATPVSSNASAGPCLVAVSGKTNNLESTETILEGDKNSGLLESLLMESKTLSSKGTSKNEKLQAPLPDKGKRVMEESADEEEEEVHATKRVKLSGETSDENQGDDISFAQSSIGTKEPVVEEINSMDDDLSSLLSNFPSSMPLPEWYPRSRNVSGESETGDHEAEEDGSVLPQAAVTRDASPNLEWALGSGYWNNMPSIC